MKMRFLRRSLESGLIISRLGAPQMPLMTFGVSAVGLDSDAGFLLRLLNKVF